MYQSPESIPPPRRWWSGLTDPPLRRRIDWGRLGVLVLVYSVIALINAPWDFSRTIPRVTVIFGLGVIGGAVAEVLPLRWRRLSSGLRIGQLVAALIMTLVMIGMIILS